LEAPRSSNTAEINIVGRHVDEAMDLVDKFLDASVMAGRDQIRIIHGFGSGALRRAVAELLREHPHVASHRPGDAREGGAGATLVELRG
jgi:DNA mismatch repair protein MutS2